MTTRTTIKVAVAKLRTLFFLFYFCVGPPPHPSASAWRRLSSLDFFVIVNGEKFRFFISEKKKTKIFFCARVVETYGETDGGEEKGEAASSKGTAKFSVSMYWFFLLCSLLCLLVKHISRYFERLWRKGPINQIGLNWLDKIGCDCDGWVMSCRQEMETNLRFK